MIKLVQTYFSMTSGLADTMVRPGSLSISIPQRAGRSRTYPDLRLERMWRMLLWRQSKSPQLLQVSRMQNHMMLIWECCELFELWFINDVWICFRLVFPWRTFYFYASTADEAKKWVTAIENKLVRVIVVSAYRRRQSFQCILALCTCCEQPTNSWCIQVSGQF